MMADLAQSFVLAAIITIVCGIVAGAAWLLYMWFGLWTMPLLLFIWLWAWLATISDG